VTCAVDGGKKEDNHAQHLVVSLFSTAENYK
jgi:hypothetical protein